MVHNEVSTSSILGFISCQAEPLSLLDYTKFQFSSPDQRTLELIDLAFKLAEDNECPIRYIDGHFYITFFKSGLWLMTKEELNQFLSDCAEGFGIPRDSERDFSTYAN